jgi:O-antigen/teichoic acid export membrane protein
LSTQNKSLGSKVVQGAFWTVGMRWLSRFMGLASIAVIARLLTPEDFGIIAVTTALIALMGAFTDLGADTSLIRHPNPKRMHYDTVWTFTIIIHTFTAALIALLGYYSLQFYSDPRYELVLYTMSCSMFISGFKNIGITDFRRNLTYHKDFQINVSVQFIGVISTIAFAFWLRSYWALVFGGLTRTVTFLLLSYLMHPYRPHISLSARKEMFGFSFWITVRSIAMFLSKKGDRLILAMYFSPAVLGLYAIAGELASMAVFEILHPLGRVLLPALATKQNDQEWLEFNLKKIFNITATLAVATGVGLASIAEPVLTLIYGWQYSKAADMLVSLAILNTISGFSQPIGQFLLLMNKAKEFALLFLVEGIVILTIVYLLSTNHYDLQTIIYSRLAISSLAIIRLFYLLRMTKSLSWLTILLAWIRPIIAGIAMFYTLHFFQQKSQGLSAEIIVPASIVIGALIFSTVLLSLWYLMKKPVGIEHEIIFRLRKKQK